MATTGKTRDGRPIADTEDDSQPSSVKVRQGYSAQSNKRFDQIENRVIETAKKKKAR